jgi:hypothetical protein
LSEILVFLLFLKRENMGAGAKLVVREGVVDESTGVGFGQCKSAQ